MERVAEWKASGLTSAEYCEGKPFTAGGLRHWAYRLRQTEANEPTPAPAPVSTASAVRVARVVRVPGKPAASRRTRAQGDTTDTESTSAAALSVDCGGMRVMVRPGFDRGTLAELLDVLDQRGGAR